MDYIVEHTFTYNGQQVRFTFEPTEKYANQETPYYEYGKEVRTQGFAGYADDSIIVASTRTLANIVHRFMETNY